MENFENSFKFNATRPNDVQFGQIVKDLVKIPFLKQFFKISLKIYQDTANPVRMLPVPKLTKPKKEKKQRRIIKRKKKKKSSNDMKNVINRREFGC